MTKKIRFRWEGSERETGVEICEHVTLPNAYETSGRGEYATTIDIHCAVCENTYTVTELIN